MNKDDRVDMPRCLERGKCSPRSDEGDQGEVQQRCARKPTVDAACGHWTLMDDGFGYWNECSECGTGSYSRSNFCPSCGARMSGADKEYDTDSARRIFDCSSDDFGAVLNCAVRYALGRQSYMPYLVTSFITPLLPHLTDGTIACFDRDIAKCENYGNEMIDKPTWMRFWDSVKAEKEGRGLRG